MITMLNSLIDRKLIKIILLATVIVVDQISKYIIIKYFAQIIVFNQRGVWGVVPAWFGIISLVILSFWLIKQTSPSLIYWVILAAGISNFIDRLIYVGVVDWIHTFSWFPVFNLADMVISGGVGMLIIKEFNSHREE